MAQRCVEAGSIPFSIATFDNEFHAFERRNLLGERGGQNHPRLRIRGAGSEDADEQ